MVTAPVSDIRIRTANDAQVNVRGAFVLYWMTAFRRTSDNFALQRAVEHARETGKPLLVLDTHMLGRRWVTARRHRFALEGMADVAARLDRGPARHYPFVETKRGDAAGLAAALTKRACAVVTDDFPSAELQDTVDAVARLARVCFEKVDSCGILPMAAAPRVYPTAYAFRRFLQAELRSFLGDFPNRDPLAGLTDQRRAAVPRDVFDRRPQAGKRLLNGDDSALAALPVDHSVAPVDTARGGMRAAESALRRFVRDRLDDYAELRNHPDADATSNLSPYLHAGHISAHSVFAAVMKHEGWSVARLANKAAGKRSGWWGVGESAEGFLDQLVTWRELGYNMARFWPEYETYDSLPMWARDTLEEHAGDARSHVYTLDDFAAGRTHDPLWNAAQNQLRRDGDLHNYLRMLWGKKILEWTRSPQEALDVMIELNNRYALDGCDPNSYSGIFWVLGRYDRAWGPERPVFGKIRFMSSANTARKVHIREYLRRYAE